MRRTCLVIGATALLMGCALTEVSVPVELQGVYESSTPGYERCQLQIGPESIAWKDAEGGVRTHRVTRVVPPEPDGDSFWTLQHVVDGTGDAKFSFRVVAGQIQPVNQPRLTWKRRARS